MIVKRKTWEIRSSYFDVELDQSVLEYSQDRDEIGKVTLKYDSSSGMNYTASVSIELWLYWLNAGTQINVTLNHCDKFVGVLQGKFLLLYLRSNVSRCFGRWLAKKLTLVNEMKSMILVVKDVVVKE